MLIAVAGDGDQTVRQKLSFNGDEMTFPDVLIQLVARVRVE